MLGSTRELVQRAFVPPQELDNAISAQQTALAEYNIARDSLVLVQKGAREEDRQAARAQLQEAEATLRLAQVQLSHTTLTAPISGVIAERYVDRGAFISLSSPVVSIVAMDRVNILGRISDRELGALRLGQRAEVRVDGYPQEVFLGQVTRIDPTVDRTTGTIEIEIVVENLDHPLKPGMFARVGLIVASYRQVLLIPRVALLGQGAAARVFVLNEGSAHVRPVKTGFRTDDWVIVLEHLQEGEEVIVAGQEQVTDGVPVTVIGDGRRMEGRGR